MIDPTFWQFNIGQIGTVVTIISTLIKLHRSNVNRIKKEAIEKQVLLSRLNEVYNWINLNKDDFNKMRDSINRMEKYFESLINPKNLSRRHDVGL